MVGTFKTVENGDVQGPGQKGDADIWPGSQELLGEWWLLHACVWGIGRLAVLLALVVVTEVSLLLGGFHILLDESFHESLPFIN